MPQYLAFAIFSGTVASLVFSLVGLAWVLFSGHPLPPVVDDPDDAFPLDPPVPWLVLLLVFVSSGLGGLGAAALFGVMQ